MNYQITLQPGQQQFSAHPEDTVLHAAQRVGIDLPYGCRNGLCGMCKARLLSGQIHYRQEAAGLTETERAEHYILCCSAQPRSDLTLSIAPVSPASPFQKRRTPVRVETIQRLNHDVLQVKLKLPDSIRFAFHAGQYIDFILKDGRRRSFSIASAPQDSTHIELHIRHIDGGRFTGEIFDHIKVDDLFRIEGPLGSFYLRDTSARPVILMAGGTGFAPLKSIIEDSLARGIPRLLYLYWGARGLRDLYQHALASDWATRHPQIRYIPVLSEPDPEDHWQGRTGLVHTAVAADFPDLSGYEVYGSGPPAMVYAGRDAFMHNHLPRHQYFSDAFEYAND
ncbi:MAG: CDP-6-deoxy-delta-3,4-glucoseen reductase [Gammaproteobacteria bacterium]|nr:CDP-6-deoxy-delta-3,4-glucoseen reductase [Gammaproteobacteria bacterium]